MMNRTAGDANVRRSRDSARALQGGGSEFSTAAAPKALLALTEAKVAARSKPSSSVGAAASRLGSSAFLPRSTRLAVNS